MAAAELKLDLQNLHSCAEAAFKGLWWAGVIKGGVPKAHFKPEKNADYALQGRTILQSDPGLNMTQVWARIHGAPTYKNGQMEVLFALRDEGLIIGL
jgi:hypothetical protein